MRDPPTDDDRSDGGSDDRRTRQYVRRLARLAGLTLVVHAVLAALVYRDADGRDVSGVRWAAIVLVGGVPALPGYLRRR